MEHLRTWVLLLCGVALASAAIGALLPQGQSKAAFRVLTGVVFLYALVLPLKNLGHAQTLPDSLRSALPENEQALSQKSADARLLAANQVLEAAIADALRTAGYPDASVRVQCAEFDDGIAPQHITVRGNLEKDKLQAILQPFLTAHTAWILSED